MMQPAISRWWIYQQERFPLLKHGPLIAVFSVSAVCYSLLLRERWADPILLKQAGSIWQMTGFSLLQTIGSALIAFIVTLLFFLQLRIADEFKDFEDDLRYRSYRPVPRGLISLKELGIVAIASAVVQLGLSVAVSPRLLLPLLLVWGYMVLMSQEFFLSGWLKARPLFYMLSHMVIMPLIALYATACDWLNVGWSAPPGVLWYLTVSFFGGLAIEIGRKIRAPKDEERGVVTYSALWGRQKAVRIWLGILWLTTLSAVLAAMYIQFAVQVILMLLLLLTASVLVAWQFTLRPVTAWAKRIELLSGIWTLLLYLSLGILPLALRHL
ncbi:MAG TPA: UbiA family prenyltransferase [Crinalium sp.]|jgi:4-hydroxybenzoate polyprenyltransferase